MTSKKTPEEKWLILGIGLIAIATVVSASVLLREENRKLRDDLLTANQSTANANANIDGFMQDHWELPDDELFGFVRIPAGEFLMGSDPAIDRNAYDNERWSNRLRRGRVSVPEFYLGRYEVTVSQFARFVEASGYAIDAKALEGEPNYPVTNVTFTDALAYCRWLDATLRASQDVPSRLAEKLTAGWVVTLPTEAQWEKAARGPDGQIYPWGNQATTTFANYNSAERQPVGSRPCPNCRYGLADMSGNVWELTRSFYLPYPFDENAKPDLESDALFVMRGGSYADNENNVRAAIRGGVDPGVRNDAIGFRVAISPK